MYPKLAPTLLKFRHPLPLDRWVGLLLFAIAAAGLSGCDEKNPTGTDLITSTEGAQAGVAASVVAVDASATSAPTAAATGNTIALPSNETVTTTGTAFSITQKGMGGVGFFMVDNTSNYHEALSAYTSGTGYAMKGIAGGKGVGGFFSAGSGGTSSSDALQGYSYGNGNSNAVHGVAIGGAARAGLFENQSSTNSNSALAVRTMGPGTAGVFLAPNGGKGMFINSNSNDYTLDAQNSGTGFAAKFFGNGSAKGVYIQTQGGAGLQVVGGSKNAVVYTPSGAKALYTEESSEVWFTDYGFGKLENGRVRILFDPSFAQTINPNEPYHVFLQSYGDAELYVGERTPLGFEVTRRSGDPKAEFSYRIVAKRLGFEGKRLEPAPWADRMAGQVR
jgi:hypothetical protein